MFTDVILKGCRADLSPEKLGAYKPGQYKPSEEDMKDFFKYFFKNDNCLINNIVINVPCLNCTLVPCLNCTSVVNKFTVCILNSA